MSARRMMAAAVVMALSAGQALAQPDKAKELDAKQLRRMYEDVAVFGTLLNRAVEKSYGFRLQQPAVHGVHGPRDQFHQLALAEGVYLPGRGVVYNLSAPPAQGPLGTDAGPTAREPTDWERVRQELRGDKPIPSKEKTPRRPSLSESVLRLLAENGRHFKELADGEQITVAITFRGSLDCTSCHALSGRTDRFLTPGGNPYASQGGQMLQRGNPGLFGGRLTPPLPGGGQGQPGTSTEIREGSTVGDLHLRQGRYQEAAKVYEEALRRVLNEVKPTKTEADVQRLLAAVGLARKMTVALQSAGDSAGAQRGRELSLKFADAAVKLAESFKGKQPDKGTLALPARLIVSAPKKLLEQAGGGKLSLAEFRKAASVQYLRFPRPEK